MAFNQNIFNRIIPDILCTHMLTHNRQRSGSGNRSILLLSIANLALSSDIRVRNHRRTSVGPSFQEVASLLAPIILSMISKVMLLQASTLIRRSAPGPQRSLGTSYWLVSSATAVSQAETTAPQHLASVATDLLYYEQAKHLSSNWIYQTTVDHLSQMVKLLQF